MIRHNRDLNKVSHSVRATQVVLQYGVGAMIDFPSQTLMTAAPSYWTDIGGPGYKKIYDWRLAKLLHVDYFGMPKGTSSGGFVSYVRFPEWYYCPVCHRFQRLDDWYNEYRHSPFYSDDDKDMVKNIFCTKCNSKPHLIVSRLVTACEHGHIDDFPWIEWTHKQNITGARSICGSPSLKVFTSGSSSDGLESIKLECSCGAKASLFGAFTPGKMTDIGVKCKGRHPWKNSHEKCDASLRVLQRGSSSVYFPVIESSIVIPPFSSAITELIQNSSMFSEFVEKYNELAERNLNTEEKTLEVINAFSQPIANEIKQSVDSVSSILALRYLPDSDKAKTTMGVGYRAEEYGVLSGTVSASGTDNGEFILEVQPIEAYSIPHIKRIALVHKVREVQALVGFTRIKPFGQLDGTADPDEAGDISEYVNIKKSTDKWYPACESRGEGLFIEFDDEGINEWQVANTQFLQKRVDVLNKNYINSFSGKNSSWRITPKFLLLHTIAHLLIKQLSFECGYSIASLKERLYCSEMHEGKLMSGIFIYTSSGDSEGTMGGLVRQGYPDTFPDIFKKAIESALTCSNDPVCSLSEGQGRDSLNLAACYSCTLIPETSCERYNAFLDRGVVVGTFDHTNVGFYSKQLYDEAAWEATVRVPTNEEKAPEKKTIEIIDSGEKPCSFDDFIQTLSAYATSQSDMDLIEEFKKSKGIFETVELPTIASLLSYNGTEITSILLWDSEQIAVFFSDFKDDYDIMADSEWTVALSDNSAETDKVFEKLRRI